MLQWAVNEQDGPVAIRYPRGGDGAYTDSGFRPGEVVCAHKTGSDCAIVTYGTAVNRAMEAAAILQNRKINCAVLRLTGLHDLSSVDLSQWKKVIVLEDVYNSCSVYESLAAQNPGVHVAGLNFGDGYITHGNLSQLYTHYAMDAEGIAQFVQEVGQ